LVVISNCVDKAEKALSIYRSKDVVEESFHRLKALLDMRRLRMHCDSTMRSKVFVSFLSLVLVSHINKIMIDNQLYDKYIIKEVIDIVESFHRIKIKNYIILEPLISEQKTIFEAFNVDKPDILDVRA
jgi:transposase